MTDKCSVDECDKPISVKWCKLCNAHYLRRRKYGRTEAITDLSGLRNKFPKEHNSYRSMKARCLCKTDCNYSRWGGRGIKICDRWLEKPNGFKNFLDDMGARPDGATLDRIDNNGDYCPENCRWATVWQQIANTSRIIGKYSGVYYVKNRDRWCADIQVGSMRKTKSFETMEEAIEQRKQWEKEYLYCRQDKGDDTIEV